MRAVASKRLGVGGGLHPQIRLILKRDKMGSMAQLVMSERCDDGLGVRESSWYSQRTLSTNVGSKAIIPIFKWKDFRRGQTEYGGTVVLRVFPERYDAAAYGRTPSARNKGQGREHESIRSLSCCHYRQRVHQLAGGVYRRKTARQEVNAIFGGTDTWCGYFGFAGSCRRCSRIWKVAD